MTRRSITAEKVARDILADIGRGKKVNITQTAVKNGLSYEYGHTGLLQKTKSFRNIIDPFLNKMIQERNRLIKAISEKDLSKVAYRDAIDGVDKLTKNIQLLSGGATNNVAVKVGLADEEKEALLNLLK